MSKVAVAKYLAVLFFTLTTLSECSYRSSNKQFDVQPLSEDDDKVFTFRTDLEDGSECIYPTDCHDVKECGGKQSGVYRMFPFGIGDGFLTYCDMKTEGGGWLVFQRRQDGSEDFYRNWKNYTDGFGNWGYGYWNCCLGLWFGIYGGLDKLHLLTSQRHCELLINLGSYDEGSRHARYDRFYVSDENLKFKLFLGTYSGNAGDSFKEYHNGHNFSTYDSDNDMTSSNCAEKSRGGWWHGRSSCHYSNLNGQCFTVTQKPDDNFKAISWYYWKNTDKYSMQFVEMKLRAY